MTSNVEKVRQDFQALLTLGKSLQTQLYGQITQTKVDVKKQNASTFLSKYQSWYSEARLVVEQLLPQRLSEFVALYEGDPKRKSMTTLNFCISDYCLGIGSQKDAFGVKTVDSDIAFMKYQSQLQILESISRRFESSLFDIKQLATADLFDSELDSSDELLKQKFVRPAGVIAGVILEKHLSQVCSTHKVALSKKEPTISNLNDLLKDSGIIDIPVWRSIQHLTDLRNLCAHNKGREPTKDEVSDLIAGVRKISKTIF